MTKLEKYYSSLKLKEHNLTFQDVCKEAIAFQDNKTHGVYCGACGQYHRLTHKLTPDKEKIVCSNCGIKLTRAWSLLNLRKRTKEDFLNAQKTEIVEGVQVVRIYEIRINWRKRESAKVQINEVMRCYINDKLNVKYFGKALTAFSYYKSWKYNTAFKLSKKKKYDDMIGLRPRKLGYEKVLPIFKKYGYVKCDIGLVDYVETIKSYPYAETFQKLNQPALLAYCVSWRRDNISDKIKEIFLAIKWGYKFSNSEQITEWCDYIGICRNLGLDIKNPKYLCPDNLQKAHQKYLKQFHKQQLEDKIKVKEKQYGAAYKNKIKKYKNINLGNEEIQISVIPTITDIALEGAELHHCVFEREYFKKANTILLSCKVKEKRTETAEIDIKKWKIEQLRGACNQSSPYHEQIKMMIEKNINKLKFA